MFLFVLHGQVLHLIDIDHIQLAFRKNMIRENSTQYERYALMSKPL